MKKIIFLIMISFISLKSMAGDGDKFFNISGGWQWKNTVNAVVGLEFEGKYHNAYVQVDPEQWLFVIHKYLTVEFFIILIRAFIRMFHPQRIRIT